MRNTLESKGPGSVIYQKIQSFFVKTNESFVQIHPFYGNIAEAQGDDVHVR